MEDETFGDFVRNKRIGQSVTLRDFCRKMSVDASNWSKVERNILYPPRSKIMLNNIVELLNFNKDDCDNLIDLAIFAYIPGDIKEDHFETVHKSCIPRSEIEGLIEDYKEELEGIDTHLDIRTPADMVEGAIEDLKKLLKKK